MFLYEFELELVQIRHRLSANPPVCTPLDRRMQHLVEKHLRTSSRQFRSTHVGRFSVQHLAGYFVRYHERHREDLQENDALKFHIENNYSDEHWIQNTFAVGP